MKYLSSSTIGAQIFLLLSIFGSIIAINMYVFSMNTLLLVILGYFLYGCLGIVITYHRHLTHKSFNTHPYIVKLFSLLGCFAGTGSPLAWVAIHINHHLKSDKPSDPHSPHYKGFKIFTLDYRLEVDRHTRWRMREVITNRYQQFLHRYYFAINIVYSVILYSIGGFYLMIFFHWMPAAVTAIMSNVVNYVGHMPNWPGSYRTFNINDKSANNFIFAIPSWGEAWHNNHHRYPRNYMFGQKWYEIDISGMVIKLIKI
jgi:stearoyl-CoA desaturase (delta-9 desaturase)